MALNASSRVCMRRSPNLSPNLFLIAKVHIVNPRPSILVYFPTKSNPEAIATTRQQHIQTWPQILIRGKEGKIAVYRYSNTHTLTKVTQTLALFFLSLPPTCKPPSVHPYKSCHVVKRFCHFHLLLPGTETVV